MNLIELDYLPPISWFARVWNAPELTLEACEHYHKGTYRNRCHIAGPNGVQRLTVPLRKGKNQQLPIREVEIAYDEPWHLVHWRSIEAAYGNAPFFEHFGPELRLFYEKKWSLLFDFNLALLEFLLKKLAFQGKVNLSETWLEKSAKAPGDWRDAVSPKSKTPPDWFVPRPYQQVFTEKHGFLADLSALDLLFCCGKNHALDRMKSG